MKHGGIQMKTKAGDQVFYHDIPATVVSVARKGVTVRYYVTIHLAEIERVERVSARYLRPRPPNFVLEATNERARQYWGAE